MSTSSGIRLASPLVALVPVTSAFSSGSTVMTARSSSESGWLRSSLAMMAKPEISFLVSGSPGSAPSGSSGTSARSRS